MVRSHRPGSRGRRGSPPGSREVKPPDNEVDRELARCPHCAWSTRPRRIEMVEALYVAMLLQEHLVAEHGLVTAAADDVADRWLEQLMKPRP